MSGSGGVSIARSSIRGENRFYNPPPMRKMAQLQREKQRRDEKEVLLEPRKSPENKNHAAVSASESSVGTSDSSESGRVQSDGSNLDRFLEHTTPIVAARLLPMRSRLEHKPSESNYHSYFLLEDLWDSFAEWSAYGAGVPLHMHESDSTVQYYVPYLSGIQLYVDSSESPRKPVDDSEVSSEGSRIKKLSNNAKTLQNAVDSSLQDQSVAGSLSSVESEISNPKERLLFEYLEYELPFKREPLSNKISHLASRFPELRTYRSCDLSPSSWISVSWYPIYRIPVGPTLQNLDACFLTFHSLSTQTLQKAGAMSCSDSEPSTKLPLPTFGLASYKLKVSVWNPNRAQEIQKITDLLQAADKWLKRLQVEHPDYKFFTK